LFKKKFLVLLYAFFLLISYFKVLNEARSIYGEYEKFCDVLKKEKAYFVISRFNVGEKNTKEGLKAIFGKVDVRFSGEKKGKFFIVSKFKKEIFENTDEKILKLKLPRIKYYYLEFKDLKNKLKKVKILKTYKIGEDYFYLCEKEK
jgi:sulfur relay (sulfurtransferase) DsrF/TusC family protein